VVSLTVVAAISHLVVSSNSKSADLHVKVSSVSALDGNTVRIYFAFTNTGKGFGGETCVMNTSVPNQDGDQVNIEVNSTGTNQPVMPGSIESLYQDVGVNSGDARFVTARDVKISNCS
jgi:hypothetical protein